MGVSRRTFLGVASAATMAGLSACAQPNFSWFINKDEDKQNNPKTSQGSVAAEIDLKEFAVLELDMGAWSYDTTFDCYYQLGVPYCLHPATEAYESLAIFVPGPYFEGKKRLNGSYECTLVPEAKIASFTAATAPIMMPLNSARFEAQACPTGFSYTGLTRYLSAGLIYVYAGFRGRSAIAQSNTSELIAGGAPWPVVDLKAAIRYLRYNKDLLPGNTNRIFAFGFGGGGGIAACLGSSGDSSEFEPYLKQIGAAMHDGKEGKTISDAIQGVGAWCPITALDAADASYEWMMGQFSHEGARAEGSFGQALSTDLATAYGKYVNKLGLLDEEGKPLSLDAAEDGSLISGTYYDYLLGLVEAAASKFFSSTAFPYTYTPADQNTPLFPGDPTLAKNNYASVAAASDAASDASSSNTNANASSGVRTVQSTVYDSIESYVGSLTAKTRWLVYSATAQRANVTNLWDFVEACRPAQHTVGAFDACDRSSIINQLFGVGEETSLHFDQIMAEQIAAHQDSYSKLKDWDVKYAFDWKEDLSKTDTFELDVASRVQMMSPLHFIADNSKNNDNVKAAPYWRINAGLFSNMTSFADEVNLTLALKAYKGIKEVAFMPVWGSGFELAECEGNAEEKFVSWVTQIYEKE
ncbi:subtype A tannase [Olegusella massiliensis]|uniref:subtype A tannase n=1 Tax=Olegusella massiliensis TaxID=1776381 RepID=UPI0040555839